MGSRILEALRSSMVTFLRVAPALGALVAMLGSTTNCHAERRLALVIGNDRYENIAIVPKAADDARAVAATLAATGYRTTVLTDAKRAAADAAFKTLEMQIEVGDLVLLYFVGNGASLNGRNLMLFVDAAAARVGEEASIIDAGVPFEEAVAVFQRRGAKVFAIFDAARSNPFDRPGVRPPEIGVGLEPVAGPLAMTYWLLSAGPGEISSTRTSSRDTSPNSVFARVLLTRLGDETLTIADLALAVQIGLRDLVSAAHLKQAAVLHDGGIGGVRVSLGKVVMKYPEKLKLRVKPGGGNRFTLADISDIEDELPPQEDCEKLGQKFGDELRREVGDSIRFWVRIKRADIGYCQLASNRWFVEYFDRNIQEGLVLDLRN